MTHLKESKVGLHPALGLIGGQDVSPPPANHLLQEGQSHIDYDGPNERTLFASWWGQFVFKRAILCCVWAQGYGWAFDDHVFFSCRVMLCLVFGFVLDGESFVLYGDVHGSQEHGEAQDCLKMSFFW
jgi:hypothetical protein